MHSCTFGYDTPGDGIAAPARYTATIARVKRIFFRRSGVVRADRNALSTDILLVTRVPVAGLSRVGGRAPGRPPVGRRSTGRSAGPRPGFAHSRLVGRRACTQ